MTEPMFITLIILLCAIALFIQGKFRADLIALSALSILGLLGILTLDELVAGFANQVVIMLAGLFIVGAGLLNTGIVEKAGNKLLDLCGGSEWKSLLIVMLTAGILSAFLSGTGIVSILLPLVMSMALQQKTSPTRYLLPLAYASSIGGLLTLTGTPSNMIVADVLRQNGIGNLSFFDFAPVGLVAFAAGLFFMLTLGRLLLPEKTIAANNSVKGLSAGELAGMYKVYDRLHYLHIPATSDIVGERLSDLQLPIQYELTLIEIQRKPKDKQLPLLQRQQTISARADEVLHPEDIILVFGEEEAVERLALNYELEFKHFNTEQIKKHFLSSRFGLTEILIVPNSDYENQTLIDVHFREKYQCNVLAINRNGEYIQADVGTERLKPGDAILIHGEWENIERISSDLQDVIVIGSTSEDGSPVNSKGKAWIALGITALMVILLSMESVPAVLSVLTAALLMVVTGCVRSMEDAYQKINWEPVLLIAAMFGITAALDNTGGVRMISDWLAVLFSNIGAHGILAVFYLLTLILSQFIPYGAATVIMTPIALTSAVNQGIDPLPVFLCLAVAGSLALSTPRVATTNALVMTAGDYKHKDFIMIGISIQIFIGVIMVITIPWFFPF
ncbi:di/tricarboxylate transporter [Peribacillus frigoritolerans]|uniref:SLC13 family permease n=1 Tax=Peribacillus frigoritolerans TaxID=450367 RepID=UPI00209EE5A8|nr:SLC13 family permease [Peribacillus frigoritolerans]MCP1490851.1 di/tricarboxylate transporter [Peribacillus frigoritolerans]